MNSSAMAFRLSSSGGDGGGSLNIKQCVIDVLLQQGHVSGLSHLSPRDFHHAKARLSQSNPGACDAAGSTTGAAAEDRRHPGGRAEDHMRNRHYGGGLEPRTRGTYRMGGGSFTEIRTDQRLTGIGPGMDAASVAAGKAQLLNVFLTGGGWNCRHQWIIATDEMIGSVNENLVGVGSVIGAPPSDIAGPVRSAVAAINRVHKVPELERTVPVVSDAAMIESAKYRWDKSTRRPLDIRLNPRGDHAELSTVLEIGHLLDHQAIGTPGIFASEYHPLLAEWRQAIDSTRAVQKLEDLRDAGSIPYRFSDGVIRQVRVREIAKDLLHPWELFSRSYAQFISEDSGSTKIASQIQGFRNPKNPSSVVPQFWDEDDFRDISGAFKRLIIKLGWKK